MRITRTIHQQPKRQARRTEAYHLQDAEAACRGAQPCSRWQSWRLHQHERGMQAQLRGQARVRGRNRQANRRGFTMLELLVVVGILSGLSVTLYSVISVTQSSARVNQAVQDVQMIRGAAGSWVSGRPTQYTSIGITSLNSFLPARLRGGSSKNPWGGNYAIAAKSGAVDKIVITLTSVVQAEGEAMRDRLNSPGQNVATLNTSSVSGGRTSLTVEY